MDFTETEVDAGKEGILIPSDSKVTFTCPFFHTKFEIPATLCFAIWSTWISPCVLKNLCFDFLIFLKSVVWITRICFLIFVKCVSSNVLSSFSQSALWKVKYNLFPSSNMAIVTHGSRLRMHGSCNNVPTGLKFRALV